MTDPIQEILDAVERALREEDYIDLGNHPGEEDEYRRLSLRLVQSLARHRFGIQQISDDDD